MVSAHARRNQVQYAVPRGLSTRSACALMQVSRSSLNYEAQLPKKDAPVIEVMQDLSAQYPRFGYRRIHIYLDRAGHKMSIERAHRLWRLAELQVPRRKSKKRAASGRPRPTPATGVNQVWAYDFVFDACANGRQLKCLTLIDEYTREALAIRDECLNLEWFRNRAEARVLIEQWRQHYNSDRPHSSLGYRTPFEFKQQLQQFTPTKTDHAILN